MSVTVATAARDQQCQRQLLINQVDRVLGYWHQRADDRHGNPPQRLPGAISG